MKNTIKDAVEGLYAAFAGTPRPHYVDGCPCCIERKEIGTLLSKPIREISADELSSYASSVFLTVGDEADFLYFLPRIFEISATYPSWWPDPEVALGKLSYVKWKEWDKEKRAAIEAFIEAVFEHLVVSDTSDSDSWFCAIARTGRAIEPLLERIKNEGKPLIALYEWNSTSLTKGKLSNEFWDDIPDSRQFVIAWFQSEEIKKKINEQYQAIYEN
jgi:hypothetical protein